MPILIRIHARSFKASGARLGIGQAIESNVHEWTAPKSGPTAIVNSASYDMSDLTDPN